ncbi:hypothetical protein BJ508DRAFT_415403 [Ascobolus immersus RN42]|uniref:DAGKc domain-containing protein n=1 Tax=Ascobolus immersus RN42 TaxID=1160509 RepID=A0A3N4I4L0_ASCIM|nr:hypothetical protein BJ508DRAFT_415403 [Ascobolus immersus RN42]
MWNSIPITIPQDELNSLSEALTSKIDHSSRLLRALQSNSALEVPRSNLICFCPNKATSGQGATAFKDGYLLYITPHPEEVHHVTDPIDESKHDGEETKTYTVASAYHPDQKVFKVRPAEGASEEALRDLYVGDSGIPENLDTRDGTREVIIVVSTKSGFSLGAEIWKHVVQPVLERFGSIPLYTWNSENGKFDSSPVLDGSGADGLVGYKLLITQDKDDIARLARTGLAPFSSKVKQQNILLLSGDTAISELLNNLPAEANELVRTITLLPTGTGNALSSSHHKLYTPLTNFLLGKPHKHPVFKARFSPGAKWAGSDDGRAIATSVKGAVVFSWGFHACLVADSDGEEYRQKYGKERFAVAARENLTPAPHVFKGRVFYWDGEGKENRLDSEDHFYVLSALVSNLEKTLTIAPMAPRPKPVDAEGDHAPFTLFTIASGTSPERAFAIMGKAYDNGSHVNEPEVGFKRARKIRIEFLEPDWSPTGEESDVNPAWGEGRYRRLCLDGATVEVEKDGWAEVEIDGHLVELFKG